MEEAGYHVPVLLREAVDFLRPSPGKLFLDATLGGGGHTAALLDAGAEVIALDRDADAVGRALAWGRSGLRIVQSNYAQAAEVLAGAGIRQVDGILADLGVSSHQLDTGERGFSFQREGPLDMRMDRTRGASAADLLDSASEEEIARIIFEYGDERKSRRIARAIVRAREKGRIETTLALAEVVESAVPRTGAKHPATRVFQALRIAVNAELESLDTLLASAPNLLAPGARFAVITFHSLEDRAVKHDFRNRSRAEVDRPEWPAPRVNPDYCYRQLTPKPVEPSAEEIARNPRSRSARLRATERIDYVA